MKFFQGGYKMGKNFNKKAFSLYIWLILFTLIVSGISVVIFNYVSADIRTSNKFFKNIKKTLDLDSYVIAAVELYKQNNLLNSNILNTGYSYSIKLIDSSKLLVNILKGNDLYARYVVQYSMDLGSINKIVGNPTYFKANNQYNNTLVAANSSTIDTNANKIFNSLILLPNANITDSNGTPIDINQSSKYTNNLITDIDIPNLNQSLNEYISQYYRNYYQMLYDKYFDQSGNPRNGVYLYQDDNIGFTIEGDVVVKKQAKIGIAYVEILTLEGKMLTSGIGITVLPSNITYLFFVSKYAIVEGNSGNDRFVFDYTTNKDLVTNDLDLANSYQSRRNIVLYYENAITKSMNLNDKYISIKTPKKEFVILALNDIILDSSSVYNNIQVIVAPNKNVSIKTPFRYWNYDIYNHSLPVDSNSFIRVIADNINIDANNNTSIDICGIYVAFYNSNSSINIINAPNNLRLNVFGAFQTYNGIKLNGQNISNN